MEHNKRNGKVNPKVAISSVILGSTMINSLANAATTDDLILKERVNLETSISTVESYLKNLNLSYNTKKIDLSKDLLEPSLNAAIIILNNEQSTVQDLTVAAENLNKTLTFIKATRVVSEAEIRLSDKVQEINNFLNSVVIGEDIGEYPKEAEDYLRRNLEAAESLLSNPDSPGDMALNRIYANLVDAESFFKKSQITVVDKTELINTILEVEALYYTFEVGETPGYYYKHDLDEFLSKIENAQEVSSDDTVRLAIVNQTMEELRQFAENFPSRIITVDSINRTQLLDEIAAAEIIYNNNLDNIGFNTGNYLKQDIEELFRKIDEARRVSVDLGVSQATVNVAADNLRLAVSNFVSSVITADKEALRITIEEAENILLTTEEGDVPGKYPYSERSVFEMKINHAKSIYETVHHEQATIDNVATFLAEAIITYKDSVIKEDEETLTPPPVIPDDEDPSVDFSNLEIALETTINIITNHRNATYLESEIKELNDLVTEGNKLLELEDPTQADIEALTSLLEMKVNQLEKREQSLLKSWIVKLEALVDDCKKLLDKLALDGKQEEASKVNNGIATCENILASGSYTIGDYENSYNLLYDIKAEIDTESGDKNPSDNNGNDSNGNGSNGNNSNGNGSNENNGGTDNESNGDSSDDVEDGEISEEEQKQIEICISQTENILLEIRRALSTTEVGFAAHNCTENQKRALMYVYNMIEPIYSESTRLHEIQSYYQQAYYALLDFNNRTISITNLGELNGRNLTGIIKKLTVKPKNQYVSHSENFIPQAGMPIDIKELMTVLGSSFVGLGIFLKRKK